MRLAGNVACMSKMRNVYKILLGKPERRDETRDKDVDGRRLLK
jgi:hypothetical protein